MDKLLADKTVYRGAVWSWHDLQGLVMVVDTRVPSIGDDH